MRLPELEDQHWFPDSWRRYQMDFLSLMARWFALYQPVLPLLKSLEAKYGFTEWTDCCTGTSGPVQYLMDQGFRPARIWLCDRFPAPASSLSSPSLPEVVKADLLQDPVPGSGLITVFNAWHHFSETERSVIAQKISLSKRPLLIAEITRPTPVHFLLVTLATTIGVWLLTPFIRPFSWNRILLTYLLPVNVVTITWDGWVSVIRSVRKDSFIRLAQQESHKGYTFQYQEKGPLWRKLAILTGQPQA